MSILFKYKVECQCGECNKEWIIGYGDWCNIVNSINHGVLRSVPYPYLGFLIQRIAKMKIRFVFRYRPIKWFLRTDWYNTRRTDFMGEEYFFVDIGAVTLGVAWVKQGVKK